MDDHPKAANSPQPADHPVDHYRVAFDNSHEAIVIAQDGVLKVANPAAAKATGYPLDELLGKSFLDLLHPSEHEMALELYRRRLEGDDEERSLVARVVTAGGATLSFEAHSMPVVWEGRPAVLVFLADVTAREAARREASEMSNLFRRIAEVAPCFLFVYDYDLGRDVYINRSVPEELGYSKEEAQALGPYPFLKLCHPDDLEPALNRETRWHGLAEDATDAVEFRMKHRNGEWRWFRSYNAPFHVDADGHVRQMLGLCEDITVSKRSEESLRRNERLESLGLLAGGIAHDFSNLLTPIVGMAELLREQLEKGTTAHERAVAIESAAGRATELVRQLLAFAGRGEVECKPIQINTLVEDVVHLFRSLRQIATPVELRLAEGLPRISGDSSQLRQVILNLLTNACDAVIEAGTEAPDEPRKIVISTASTRLAPEDLPHLLLREGLVAGPVVELVVEDDGVGMDQEELTRLGEPFFSTKPDGRGLGLPASLGILRAHRAGIELDTKRGRGTRFHLYFREAAAGD
ncbi:MAG: PAS domain S-box protein [Thermoanaerobaculia bacterium]